MRNNTFPYNYKTNLFGKFTVFANSKGELEVADSDKDMVLQNKITGVYHKENINDFCNLIKTIFPTRREQKDILCMMFGK